MVARFDWEQIRAEYEAGSSMGQLAKKYEISKPAISQRAKRECWTQDISGAVNRLTEAKVNGLVNTVNPQKKAEALDAAAEKKAEVILRHQQEWDVHRKLMNEALTEDDFEKAKLAKITAETLRIRQEGERKAWGILEKTQSEVEIKADMSLAAQILEGQERARRLR